MSLSKLCYAWALVSTLLTVVSLTQCNITPWYDGSIGDANQVKVAVYEKESIEETFKSASYFILAAGFLEFFTIIFQTFVSKRPGDSTWPDSSSIMLAIYVSLWLLNTAMSSRYHSFG